MSAFAGFPHRSNYVPVPAALFSQLLEDVHDLGELRCLLRVLFLLHRQQGRVRYLTASALEADVTLLRACHGDAAEPRMAVKRAVDACVDRGTLLRVPVESEGRREEVLLLNTPQNRTAVEQLRRGELELDGLTPAAPVEEPPAPRQDVFTLYEENIGVITPLIAEELKDAEETYGRDQIEDAMREAVAQNRRSWRYVEAILKRWAQEGKEHGADWRYAKAVPVDKVFRQPRGPLISR